MLPIANIFGGPEILIVILVIALLFGIKRLPELGKGLAEGIVEFKKASKKLHEEEPPAAKPENTNESNSSS